MNADALFIKNLYKKYPNGAAALNGISLHVSEGDFFALLGANGAGKSTTIGVICSLVLKDAGTVKIFGCDIDGDFPRARSHVGVVPQEFNFGNFEKTLDVLVNQAGYYGVPRREARARAEYYLKLLDLWDHREKITLKLSGGMRRRLMIARAMLHEPRLLILDEPTAGVDIELRRVIWDFTKELNRKGVTIILTTHYLEEAEQLCRNVAIIDAGKIVHSGSMRSVLGMLDKQTFVLDTREDVEVGELALEQYQLRRTDHCVLEASVKKGESLNALMAALNTRGIEVVSIRPRTGRLEETFLDLTKNETAK